MQDHFHFFGTQNAQVVVDSLDEIALSNIAGTPCALARSGQAVAILRESAHYPEQLNLTPTYAGRVQATASVLRLRHALRRNANP